MPSPSRPTEALTGVSDSSGDAAATVSEGVRAGGFRPDIEGLRAVAVLAVVLFHAGVPGLGGGFVGVDVFFVVSGFLITGLLWRDVAATGTVRVGRFFGARVRRLLPAGTLVLIVTAIGSAWLLPPLQAREVLGDAVASALYAGNYRFALRDTDYLAAETTPSPFQHYWSLGVEEQFYLLWPALIVTAAWLIRRRRTGTAQAPSARPYTLVLAAVAVASFAVSLSWTWTSPPWAFFSLPTRAWELALGGLVALSVPLWRRMSRRAAVAAGWSGLALIAAACVRLGETTPYPGLAALLPAAGTALVVGAGCAAPLSGAGRWLALPVMRAVGRLSYSWYLWHWPLLILAPPLLGRDLGLTGRLVVVAVAALLAALTLRLVENPIRFAAGLRDSPRRSLMLGAAVTAVAVGVCAGLLVLRPVPVGQGEAAAALTVTAPSEASASDAGEAPDPHEALVQELTAQVQAAVAASAGPGAVPSNLVPPLARAAASKPAVFFDGCVRSWLEVGQAECTSGDVAAPVTVTLVGDSHAAMWSPAFEQIAAERNWRLQTMGKVTCPLLDLPLTSPYLGREYTECVQWRGEALARLEAARPALVVLSMSRRYGGDFGFTTYGPQWLDSLTRTVARLRATGARVLVLGPVPDPQSTVPTCLSAHLDDASACAPERARAVNASGVAAEAAATAAGGGQYADLTELFCTAGTCPVVVGNDLVFRDDNHLTVEHARALAPVVAALADRALAGG